ncbi:hypothetical protein ACFE04_013063 [Oxalis oulophora]
MASQQELIATNKGGAEIFYEDAICRQKINELLVQNRLPNGLLPLKNVTELGYNKSTGFLWAKQQEKVEHKFAAISKISSFDQELCAFMEDRKMSKISGVKAKVLMVWVTVGEFAVDDKTPDKLDFITAIGAKKSFPFSAFELPK